jgi:hypothetical protein
VQTSSLVRSTVSDMYAPCRSHRSVGASEQSIRDISPTLKTPTRQKCTLAYHRQQSSPPPLSSELSVALSLVPDSAARVRGLSYFGDVCSGPAALHTKQRSTRKCARPSAISTPSGSVQPLFPVPHPAAPPRALSSADHTRTGPRRAPLRDTAVRGHLRDHL